MGDIPDEMKEAASKLPVATVDPKMQEAMKSPQFQQYMKMQKAMMQNPKLQEKIKELRDDPEMKPLLEQLTKGGPNALAELAKNPELMKKFQAKLGDAPTEAAAEAGFPLQVEPSTSLGE